VFAIAIGLRTRKTSQRNGNGTKNRVNSFMTWELLFRSKATGANYIHPIIHDTYVNSVQFVIFLCQYRNSLAVSVSRSLWLGSGSARGGGLRRAATGSADTDRNWRFPAIW